MKTRLTLIYLLTAGIASSGASASDWPSFRGRNAAGVADGQATPATWNVETGENIKWKTPIPGLAHSSPIVSGGRVFITTAVSSDPEPYLKVGLYGASPDHPEDLEHDFRVYCLDQKTGKIVWQQTAHRGIPKIKRHIKSTHANCTPATDGEHVIAFFGSEGLFCYDFDGKLLWKQDLGLLDSGAFNSKDLQWAFASSPIIYKHLVIVQCDVNNQSFIAAFDIKDGKRVWHVERESLPSWATPTVFEGTGRAEMVVNGTPDIFGYDPLTGKELWKFTGNSLITTPTPILIADDLVFVTSGYRPIKPIYAFRLGLNGNFELTDGEASNKLVAWSNLRRGPYMPTPIAYRGHLYVITDRGVLTCYDPTSGKQHYRERVGDKGGAFTASPVAADGKLYFTSEEGEVFVVRAGPKYELIATNSMGAVCLPTPAISDGVIFQRTRAHVYAIGN